MLIAVGTLLLALATGTAADVKGKWDGTVTAQRPDGTLNSDAALLILDQKDTAITGSIGGNESDQHPITSGTIEGNKVVIVAKHSENGREYKLELSLEGEEMKGTVLAGDRTAQLTVKRRKE